MERRYCSSLNLDQGWKHQVSLFKLIKKRRDEGEGRRERQLYCSIEGVKSNKESGYFGYIMPI